MTKKSRNANRRLMVNIGGTSVGVSSCLDFSAQITPIMSISKGDFVSTIRLTHPSSFGLFHTRQQAAANRYSNCDYCGVFHSVARLFYRFFSRSVFTVLSCLPYHALVREP